MLTKQEYELLELCNALLPHGHSAVHMSGLMLESAFDEKTTRSLVEKLTQRGYLAERRENRNTFLTLTAKGRNLRAARGKRWFAAAWKTVLLLIPLIRLLIKYLNT